MAARLEFVGNHPNRGSNRFNNAAANPAPAQILEQIGRSGRTQEKYAELAFKSVRSVEDWLARKRRMPPDTYELIEVKVRAEEMLKRGRIAPKAVEDLGLYDEETQATPALVRAQLERSGKTQEKYGALGYRTVAAVEDWLSGERQMQGDTYQLIEIKIRAAELVKRGRIAPQAIKDLGLQLPGEG